MKYFSRITLLTVLFLSHGAFAQGTEMVCQKEIPERVTYFSGILKQVTYTHPSNGTVLKYFVVELNSPFCFVRGDSATEVTVEVTTKAHLNIYQLNPEQIEILKNNIGRHVMIDGSFYGSHTAWHVAPIVITVTDVGTPD